MNGKMFLNLFCQSVTSNRQDSRTDEHASFKSFIGVSTNSCAHIWNKLKHEQTRSLKPVHLLWALSFLKLYNVENVGCLLWKCDRKTYRKWIWIVIGRLAGLKQVRFKPKL